MLTEKPRKGQKVAWRNSKGELYGHATVLSIDGDLCWVKPDGRDAADTFIWFFPSDGQFNQLAEIVQEVVTCQN